MSKKYRLSRRTILRGLAGGSLVTVGLPALEAMLDNHGTAYAAGQPFPKRFGTWFYGVGLIARNAGDAITAFFPPSAPGPSWQPARLLQPLMAAKDYVTVLGGLQWPLGNSQAHHVSRTGPLSGSYNTNNIGNGGKQGPGADPLASSIDRIVADAWKGRTRIDSVEIAISRSGHYAGMSSFTPTQVFNGEFDPANVYKRLFGAGVPMAAGSMPAPSGPAPVPKDALARQSVLDAVLADAQELRKRLGKADGVRLDAHLSGLDEIENQIKALEMAGSLPSQAVAACKLPPSAGMRGDSGGHEDLEGISKVMSDLLVMALACDLTRVFSYEFGSAEGNTIFWQVGLTQALHGLTHAGGNWDPGLLNAAEFSMKQFAYLVEKLRATPQGAGNLLDSLCLYWTTEYLAASNHQMSSGNHPILVVGKANGALRAGQYLRPASADNGSKACLALLHAVDVMAPSFGSGPGQATAPLTGLLA
jgi:hypothetical protein